MRRRALVGVSLALALALGAAPATALTVTTSRSKPVDFFGIGCGTESSLDIFLPTGARLIRSRPVNGTVLPDSVSAAPVARLTKRLARSDGKRVVRFTARSSDDVCAHPERYTADMGGWASSAGLASITYRRTARVYYRSYVMGSYLGRRYRPSRIFFGERTVVTGVRWSRWNGTVAKGRGSLVFNSCNPNCAQDRGTRYGIAIRLSDPAHCGSRYEYTRFAFTYRGRRPPGARRSYAERHSC